MNRAVTGCKLSRRTTRDIAESPGQVRGEVRGSLCVRRRAAGKRGARGDRGRKWLEIARGFWETNFAKASRPPSRPREYLSVEHPVLLGVYLTGAEPVPLGPGRQTGDSRSGLLSALNHVFGSGGFVRTGNGQEYSQGESLANCQLPKDSGHLAEQNHLSWKAF